MVPDLTDLPHPHTLSWKFFTSQNPFLWSCLLPFGLFFQVFESIEEVDQIESELKSDDVKHLSKISNGTPQIGTSSPDSGHPSSRNFSVTSGQSDSLSTEDSGIHEPNLKAQPQLVVSKERVANSSGEEGKLTEEGETKEVEKQCEDNKIEVNRESLGAVVTLSEGSKKATESSGERAEVKTEGLKTARDAFETPEAAHCHMTKMEVGESPEKTLTSENEALTLRTEPDIPKATEVMESTPPEPKMNENQVRVDIERSQVGIKDIRVIQKEPLVTKDQKESDALEQTIVADMVVSVSKDDGTEKETVKTNETSKDKDSEIWMDDANNVSATQRVLRSDNENEKKTMKTNDLPNEAETTGKRKSASDLPITICAEQTEGKVVTEKTMHKRNAPVVEEMVVPLVHEAFSTRKMSEAQDETESDESPSAIEMEEIPIAKVSLVWERKSSPKSKISEQASVPVLELRLEEAHGKPSSEGKDSEEPEMESLCPQLDSLAVNTEKNEAASPVSSIGTTYSVSMF